MKDELGDRMKNFYEDRTRMYLPRRTYTIIRVDGKAFSTYTADLKKPFDEALIQDMNDTARFLCANIQGAKLGYVQSDEITIVVTDFDKLTTSAWFDGNIQKMTSITASLATSKFNQLRIKRIGFINDDQFQSYIDSIRLAQFDARVFTVSSREEAINCLIWRQQDATRNSISSVAQSLYSTNELKGKSTKEMQELIFQKGQNWNNYPEGQKRGRLVLKNYILVDSTKENYDRSKDKEGWVLRNDKDGNIKHQVTRTVWTAIDPPIFTQAKDFLREVIPSIDEI